MQTIESPQTLYCTTTSSLLKTMFTLNFFGVRSLNVVNLFSRSEADKSFKIRTAQIANCVESLSFGKEGSNLASSA